MTRDPVTFFLQLGVVAVVAVGAILFLMRFSGRVAANRARMVQGYPPNLFPAQNLTCSGPLAELAATQARLLTIYEHVPAHSDLSVWLHMFLRELREIMDTSYHMATINYAYGRPAHLDRVVAEVQEIEAQLAACTVPLLLTRQGDVEQLLLDERLATLRLCVRELQQVAEPSAGAIWFSSQRQVNLAGRQPTAAHPVAHRGRGPAPE